MHNSQTSDEILISNIFLARISFLSYKEKNLLKKNIDNLSNLALLSIEDICSLVNRKLRRTSWNGQENLKKAQAIVQYCKLLNIKLLCYEDLNYPELLRQIDDPPFLLYCRGDESVLINKNLSIVGSRRVSPFGKEAAFSFAYDAVCDSCNVVSGLANGVDSFAHKGALSAYYDYKEKGLDPNSLGKAIAVLPSSIDEVVPYGNKKLAEQILQTGGCLISEYEPKMSITKWHYVARNRIIAGLSPATLVVEAPSGSGSLITADFALDYNRDLVFHESAFSQLANQIDSAVKNQLVREHAQGNVSKYKLENNLKKFLEAGAPVVKNYKDFCQCVLEAPGLRVKKDIQLGLFD